MSAEQKTIGLFYRHPEAFIKMISRFYTFTPEQIATYAEVLDFKLLSSNPKCSWNEDLVIRFQDKIDWPVFSALSSFFNSAYRLAMFNSRIIWGNESFKKGGKTYMSYSPHDTIAYNTKTPWSGELIDKYVGQLNLRYLSINPKVEWTYSLLDKYFYHWDWELLSFNKGLPWSEIFIELYSQDLVWSNLSLNDGIPWNKELFRKFYHKIEFEFLAANTIVYADITKDVDLVDEFSSVLDWTSICANEKLPWIEQKLMDRWQKKLEWEGLASNEILFKHDPQFFYKHVDKWLRNNGQFFNQISQNSALPWSVPFIEMYKDKWDWHNLARNPGLPWSTQLIDRYLGKWYIDPNDPFFDEAYDDSGLIVSSDVPWTIEWLIRYENHINFDKLVADYWKWEKLLKPLVTEKVVDVVMRLL